MKKYDACGRLAEMVIFSHGGAEPRSGGPAWQNSVTPSLRVRKTMSGGS
mgnify:CR=1